MKLETLSPELQQFEPLLARIQKQMEAELVRPTSENRIDVYYPDDVEVPSFAPKAVCAKSGARGRHIDVRPN